jgi:hypothetical protein
MYDNWGLFFQELGLSPLQQKVSFYATVFSTTRIILVNKMQQNLDEQAHKAGRVR